METVLSFAPRKFPYCHRSLLACPLFFQYLFTPCPVSCCRYLGTNFATSLWEKNIFTVEQTRNINSVTIVFNWHHSSITMISYWNFLLKNIFSSTIYGLGCLWQGKLFANCKEYSCHDKQLPVKYKSKRKSMLRLFCSRGTMHLTFSNGLCHHKHMSFHCSFLVQEQHHMAMNCSLVLLVISCSPILTPASS